jgi:flagellar biosynthetic protein FlhB
MADSTDKEQKTEEATPRRLEEARDKGQVPMSTELISAVGLLAALVLVGLAGQPLVSGIAEAIKEGIGLLSSLGTRELSVAESAVLIEESVYGIFGVLGAVVIPTVLVTTLTGYAQVGFRVTPKAVELDPSKIDPIKGMGRLVSPRSIVRTLFALAKITLIAGTCSFVVWMHIDEIVHVGTNDLGPLLGAVAVVAMRAMAASILVIVALGVLDLLFQRFQHGRDMRMSLQEVKEEHKLSEGDPHVRARIRSVQREFAMRRMMSDVPDATVVVTNPTHYAVALQYQSEGAGEEGPSAPRVLAKGVDHLAQRIKEVAHESGVACHEDVPLARALYARVAVGQEIPEELYGAVAAVIATVYRLKEARA